MGKTMEKQEVLPEFKVNPTEDDINLKFGDLTMLFLQMERKIEPESTEAH